jgi:hypothetical protein
VVEKYVELKITISLSNSLVVDNPSRKPLGDLIRAEIQLSISMRRLQVPEIRLGVRVTRRGLLGTNPTDKPITSGLPVNQE